MRVEVGAGLGGFVHQLQLALSHTGQARGHSSLTPLPHSGQGSLRHQKELNRTG